MTPLAREALRIMQESEGRESFTVSDLTAHKFSKGQAKICFIELEENGYMYREGETYRFVEKEKIIDGRKRLKEKGCTMTTYLISYDLHAPTNNRKKVEDSIKSIGEWCHCLSTTFLVSTSLPEESVSKIVMKNLDSNDDMIICALKGTIEGVLKNDARDWICEHL